MLCGKAVCAAWQSPYGFSCLTGICRESSVMPFVATTIAFSDCQN
jgi:hypothetical protein